jgi:hypothetical protein
LDSDEALTSVYWALLTFAEKNRRMLLASAGLVVVVQLAAPLG